MVWNARVGFQVESKISVSAAKRRKNAAHRRKPWVTGEESNKPWKGERRVS